MRAWVPERPGDAHGVKNNPGTAVSVRSEGASLAGLPLLHAGVRSQAFAFFFFIVISNSASLQKAHACALQKVAVGNDNARGQPPALGGIIFLLGYSAHARRRYAYEAGRARAGVV